MEITGSCSMMFDQIVPELPAFCALRKDQKGINGRHPLA